MSLFTRLADSRDAASLAARMRAKRAEVFLGLVAPLSRPLTILDLGGTFASWQRMGAPLPDVEIILLNIESQVVPVPGFQSICGDARDLSAFRDKSIDIVYSNSVIEHVGNRDDQARMASEIRRVGKRYFVQTPNYRFPVEPHFVFPGFHYLPLDVRALLLTRFRLGWFDREPDWHRARAAVESIRLLTKGEVQALFPDGDIFEERFLGLTKSVVALHGW